MNVKFSTNNSNMTTAINIISSVLLQGIAFFSTPIFSRLLGSEQYGEFSVFNSWVLIFMCFIGMGVTNCISTGKYYFNRRYKDFRSSILLFGILLSSIMFVVYIVFLAPISEILGYGVVLSLLIFIIAFAHKIVDFSQEVLIYEKKPMLNLLLSVSVALSVVILSIIFIKSLIEGSMGENSSEKYLGRIYGMAVPYILASIICMYVIFISNPAKLRIEYCKYGLAVGTPIVFHSLAHNILSQSDRVMMNWMNIDDSEIGIYSLYYTLSTALSSILKALNTSWCPYYYDDLSEHSWKKLKVKCRNYLELFTVLTVGFILLSHEVGKLMGGSEYRSGLNILPILTISVYFTFMYQFPVNFEFYNKRTTVIAIGTVGAAILNVILNYFMIASLGMYGAGIATAISYGGLFVFHYVAVWNLRDMDMRFHMKIFDFLPWFIMIIISAVAYFFLVDFPIIRWGLGIVIGVYEIIKIINRRRIF